MEALTWESVVPSGSPMLQSSVLKNKWLTNEVIFSSAWFLLLVPEDRSQSEHFLGNGTDAIVGIA
jgi:hypothetical protein